MPPAAIMAIGAGVSILSTAASSMAQYQQGQYAKSAATRQAEALQIQSQETQQQAGSQIAVNDYRAAHILAQISATQAASGITSEGSPGELFQSSAEEAQINDMYTKYAANIQSANLVYEENIVKTQGEEEAQAADIGAITGFTGNLANLVLSYGLGSKGGISSGIFNNGLYGSSYSDPLQLGGTT